VEHILSLKNAMSAIKNIESLAIWHCKPMALQAYGLATELMEVSSTIYCSYNPR